MKKPYLLMLIIIIAFAETSCNKYEEGPLISFRSKKNRLLGVWKVVEFKKDNEDLTQFYQDTCGCNFEFAYDTSPNSPHSKWQQINILCNENNWNFISSNDDINYFHITQSTWSLFNGEKKLYTQFGVNNDSRYRWGMYPLTVCYQSVSGFDVLRLTNKEFWLLYDDLLNIYTIKFEKI
jgi:hypothetical protein